MKFGLNSNNRRIKPTKSGQRSICPLCNGELVGKCGEIYIWHWQHYKESDCDSWQEKETFWHLNWKSKFPDDWQEVIIERYGKKHIADVKTNNNIVIEFQNSSISQETIRIREDFYERMIWVVNARSFKNNFQIRSVVNTELRNIEHFGSNEIYEIEHFYKKEIDSIDDQIKTLNSKLNDTNKIINRLKDELDTLQENLNKGEVYTDDIVNKITEGYYYWDYLTRNIIDKIELENINKIQNIPIEVKKLRININQNQKELNAILNLESIQFENIQYKEIDFNAIPLNCYYNVIATSIAAKDTIFPEIKKFRSKIELQSLMFMIHKYEFAYDYSDTIDLLTQYLSSDNEKIIQLNNIQKKLKQLIKNSITKEIEISICEIENKISIATNNYNSLVSKINKLSQTKESIKEEEESKIANTNEKIEKEKKRKRFKVMRENKGLYTFAWKYERKTWRAANCPIYFDVGENYLFEKISNGVFKKTMIDDFLNTYRN